LTAAVCIKQFEADELKRQEREAGDSQELENDLGDATLGSNKVARSRVHHCYCSDEVLTKSFQNHPQNSRETLPGNRPVLRQQGKLFL